MAKATQTILHSVVLPQALDNLAASHKAHERADSAALVATRTVTFLAVDLLGGRWNKGDEKTTAKRTWADTWTVTLKAYAMRGHMVFRDTEHVADQIRAARSHDAKVKLVNDYLDGSGKDVVSGLAKVRSIGRAIVDDIASNDSATAKTIAAMESAAGQLDAWNYYLSRRYGVPARDKDGAAILDESGRESYVLTWAMLARAFAKESAEATPATIAQRLADAADKLTDLSALDTLLARVKARRDEIAKVHEAVSAMTGEPAPETAPRESANATVAATVESAEPVKAEPVKADKPRRSRKANKPEAIAA